MTTHRVALGLGSQKILGTARLQHRATKPDALHAWVRQNMSIANGELYYPLFSVTLGVFLEDARLLACYQELHERVGDPPPTPGRERTDSTPY